MNKRDELFDLIKKRLKDQFVRLQNCSLVKELKNILGQNLFENFVNLNSIFVIFVIKI